MFFSWNQMLLLFFVYSFLGWCVEVAFVAVTVGKVVNRGFLNGPVCPIYGCGMLGVLMALLPIKQNVFLLFLGGMLICSLVELFGGWVLDKIFHMRWWDYSDKPFNVGGYICLSFSIMWGLAVVFAVKFVHTPLMVVIKWIPYFVQIILIAVFGIVMIIDFIMTLKKLIGIKNSLGQLEKIAEDLHSIGDQLKDVIGNSAIDVKDKAEQSKEKIDEMAAETKKRLQSRQEELEIHSLRYTNKIHKHRKYIRNSLVALNKSGKRIKILEYIKDMKKESKEEDLES